MKTWLEILDAVYEALDLSVTKIADRMGERKERFYQFKNRGVNPNYEFLQKLKETFPDLSAEFLLTGEGQPLKGMADESETDKDLVIRLMAEKIRDLERQLEQVRSTEV